MPYIEATNGISLNNYVRSITKPTLLQLYKIIGHLLGDGTIEMCKTSKYPRFCFTQTFKRFEYLWSVYKSISNLCQKLPSNNKGIRKGKYFYSLVIHTRSYPFLMLLYNMFYPLVNGKRIKIIPDNLIYFLNPISLACFAMDDGAKAGNSGFYLHTKGFTFTDVYKLAGMMHYVFGYTVTVQSHENRPVIYIPSKHLFNFKNLMLPHFHPSMLYKLNLDLHKN